MPNIRQRDTVQENLFNDICDNIYVVVSLSFSSGAIFDEQIVFYWSATKGLFNDRINLSFYSNAHNWHCPLGNSRK